MSDDFGNRIRGIRKAYAEQVKAGQAFVHAWFKVQTETIRPVFEIAKKEFSTGSVALSFEEKEGTLTLDFRTIPVGKNLKKLTYSPSRFEEDVVVRTDLGDGNPRSERIPLEDISTDLIESHVEDFLKNALRLKA